MVFASDWDNYFFQCAKVYISYLYLIAMLSVLLLIHRKFGKFIMSTNFVDKNEVFL